MNYKVSLAASVFVNPTYYGVKNNLFFFFFSAFYIKINSQNPKKIKD